MGKPNTRQNVRPVEHGLARFNPNNELARPSPPGQLANAMPYEGANDESTQVPMPIMHQEAQGGDSHQHIHIHMAQPQQQLSYSYRRTTTYYNWGGRLPQASAPALPATESPIANAIVRGVQLIVWLGAAAIGVVVLGKFMNWW